MNEEEKPVALNNKKSPNPVGKLRRKTEKSDDKVVNKRLPIKSH